MRGVAVLAAVALAALSGCNKASNVPVLREANAAVANEVANEIAPTQAAATPSPAETVAALDQALGTVRAMLVRTGAIGQPQDCTPGSLNGIAVTSCQVCVTLMAAQPGNANANSIDIEMLNVSIPFRRAISIDQPDIAPAEGNAGVWVPYMPLADQFSGRHLGINLRPVRIARLSPQDLAPKGMGIDPNGVIYDIAANRGAYFAAPLQTQYFLNVLSADSFIARLVRSKVGDCNGAAPAPLPVRNEPQPATGNESMYP